MSILIDKNIKVLVQGLTGKEGLFHTEQMINYGTSIVGGVTPGKGGKTYLGVPVFNTVEEAVKNTGGNVSVIFVPSPFASDAILESIFANVEVIVCITEGIPVSDMIIIKHLLKEKKSCLIGPNCPGIISPEESKVGIMPNSVFRKKGKIGIISRSGTLTYEAADQIVKLGYGISTAVGIGGDSVIGMSIKEIMELFLEDQETECIVMIGEIGGKLEIEAAEWIKKLNNQKPIISFIAGQTAPKGRTMGHAGAIIEKKIETAQVKMNIMKESGIHIVKSPANIGMTVYEVLH
ncbi:succinyl-CoA ligase (ADP-forming) subunit alpha [Blattabacterium sp. (Blattella germanica) str. Bge]|uniref:succinate--CoA ligase subunit alpha n=1 Tax=Blattabacterium sp. (Blattella germanica) TaxID=624186 RepID=UPI0001BB62CA|nr:succinate--CoA ligase subunit alpha [Blattabacterium sp. (Blattella germanica)]ACY40074.1 succinyl-CoA ligase (ADP-forming) subunit alpha [Blattabacterium sp. (Blattella germanica) str. Bge]